LDDLDEEELKRLQDRISKRLQKPKSSKRETIGATTTTTTATNSSSKSLKSKTMQTTNTSQDNGSSIESIRKQLSELQEMDEHLRGLTVGARTEKPKKTSNSKKTTPVVETQPEEEEEEDMPPSPQTQTQTKAQTKTQTQTRPSEEMFDEESDPEQSKPIPTKAKTDSNGSASKKSTKKKPSPIKLTTTEDSILPPPRPSTLPSPLMTPVQTPEQPKPIPKIATPTTPTQQASYTEEFDEPEDQEQTKPKKKAGTLTKKKGTLSKKAGTVAATTVASPTKSEPLPESSYKALVMFNYKAKHDDELNIFRNDIVIVIHEKNADWFKVRMGASGQEGLVPAKFLQKLENSKCYIFDYSFCAANFFLFFLL
jgi:hypothetical protein